MLRLGGGGGAGVGMEAQKVFSVTGHYLSMESTFRSPCLFEISFLTSVNMSRLQKP